LFSHLGYFKRDHFTKITPEETMLLSDTSLAPLAELDLIITDMSIHGILSAAALMRLVGRPEADVCFTTSDQVKFLPASRWSDCKVAFICLRPEDENVAAYIQFIKDLRVAKSEVLCAIDTHCYYQWVKIFGDDFEKLLIKPYTPLHSGGIRNVGELIGSQFMGHDALNKHTRKLLHDAELAKLLDLRTTFGAMTYRCTRSNPEDDARCLHIARRLATHNNPSELMFTWMKEHY
jgi:hypothetical protein